MNFGQAIEALKLGRKVARPGWNGKGMWLALQTPDAGSKMTLSYIYMSTADKQLVPWLASQSDMLAEDRQMYIAAGTPQSDAAIWPVAPDGEERRKHEAERNTYLREMLEKTPVAVEPLGPRPLAVYRSYNAMVGAELFYAQRPGALHAAEITYKEYVHWRSLGVPSK